MPRGSGMQAQDGFRTRTPWQTSTDIHVDYGFKFGGERRLVVLGDVFNLFNQQRVLGYDYFTEIGFQVPDANFERIGSYQNPRTLRVGARFEF